MVKQTLLKNVSAKLNLFLEPILQVCDKVRQRFIRQSLWGILASGSLMVTEMARGIHDRTTTLDYTAKRLCRQLKGGTWSWRIVQEAYLKSVTPLVGQDTVVAVDLTDLSKPRGRDFEYLALVRDGDKDELKPGYWCIEAYAVTRKETVPLVLEPFSVDDPKTPSQNIVILKTLSQLKDRLGTSGIFTFDRGFDSGEVLNCLLDNKMRFIVRLRGDRHLVLPSGVRMSATDIADRMRNLKKCLRWRAKGRRYQLHYVGYQEVKLPGRDEPLRLVVSTVPGIDGGTMMLLTNTEVKDFRDAEKVLRRYGKRWKAEEAIRLLKQEVGLEGFRIRSLRAIKRLVFLAMLAIAFLMVLSLRTLSLAERVVEVGKPLRRAKGIIGYRLARGMRKLPARLSRRSLYFVRGFQNR